MKTSELFQYELKWLLRQVRTWRGAFLIALYLLLIVPQPLAALVADYSNLQNPFTLDYALIIGSSFGVLGATLLKYAIWIHLLSDRALGWFRPSRRTDLRLCLLNWREFWPALMVAPLGFKFGADLVMWGAQAVTGLVFYLRGFYDATDGLENFKLYSDSSVLISIAFAYPLNVFSGALLNLALTSLVIWRRAAAGPGQFGVILWTAIGMFCGWFPLVVAGILIMMLGLSAAATNLDMGLFLIIQSLGTPLATICIYSVLLLISWRGLTSPAFGREVLGSEGR